MKQSEVNQGWCVGGFGIVSTQMCHLQQQAKFAVLITSLSELTENSRASGSNRTQLLWKGPAPLPFLLRSGIDQLLHLVIARLRAAEIYSVLWSVFRLSVGPQTLQLLCWSKISPFWVCSLPETSWANKSTFQGLWWLKSFQGRWSCWSSEHPGYLHWLTHRRHR